MKTIDYSPTVKTPRYIGRWFILYVDEYKERVLATCVDETTTGAPKRMRIQKHMAHGGKVLMPHQYEVLEEDPQWED
jgi:hypothetical protein